MAVMAAAMVGSGARATQGATRVVMFLLIVITVAGAVDMPRPKDAALAVQERTIPSHNGALLFVFRVPKVRIAKGMASARVAAVVRSHLALVQEERPGQIAGRIPVESAQSALRAGIV